MSGGLGIGRNGARPQRERATLSRRYWSPGPEKRRLAPTFSRINVGWESYQTDDERSIWIDDVVISSTQVGCPATL